MILYLLKITLLMGLLLAVYHLLLGRERLHYFSRFYLVGSLLISLVAPLISIDASVTQIPTIESTPIEQLVKASSQTIQVEEAQPAAADRDSLSIMLLLIGAYLLVTVVLLLRLVLNIYSMYRMVNHNPKKAIEGATLVLLEGRMAPYSWWKYIFLQKGEYESGDVAPEIISHELTHIRQHHTYDILLVELLQVVLWFNPLVYLYKRVIKQNHEYLADQAVIAHHNNVHQYQHLLLDTIFRKNTPSLVSSINFSLTKKRLIMMTKKTSNSKKSAIGVLLIALIVPLLCTFCAQSDDFNLEKELDNIGMASDFMSNEGDLYYLHGNLSVYDYRDKGKDSIAKTPFSKLSKEMLARVADKCEIVFKVQPVVAADLQRWQEKAAYGIWINNNYSENNAILKSYQPADLVLFEVEKVDGYQKDTLNGGRSQMVKLLTKENYLNFERRFKRQQNILRSGDVHKLDRLYVLF